MTSDIEFLLKLGVPTSILAERAGRSETAISYELKELEQPTNANTGDCWADHT